MEKLDELMQQRLQNGREYRNIDRDSIEMREAQEGESGMTVEGYATTFNQPYELWRDGEYIVREQVDAHAFDSCDMTDVIMQYDHRGRVFARVSNGTLQLLPDEHGLHVRADLSGTEMGRQLFEEIRGGYTSKMSFGFIVAEDRVEETGTEDGLHVILRTITRISKLFDVSAVSLPANDATEISSRAWSEGAIAKAVEECHAAEERANTKRRIQLLLELEGI